MATGDVTISSYGVFPVSGAALITAVNNINLENAEVSGAKLYLLPVGEGQIQVYSTSIEGW